MILINDKEVSIDEISFSLPYKVLDNKEYIILDEKIIFVFDVLKIRGKNNISCYSLKGEHLWNIQSPSKKLNNLGRDCLYVGITLVNNSCRVIDYWGRNFKLNIDTGTVSDLVWVR